MDIVAEYDKAKAEHAQAVKAVDNQRLKVAEEQTRLRDLRDAAALASATMKGLEQGARQAQQLQDRKAAAAQ